MQKTLLIIDDDIKLNRLLIDYLGQFNFKILTANHPLDGLRFLKARQIDLVILDIMLPDMDGFEVCKKIRDQSSLPIIMLTARGEVTDRVVGLELGADDYLPKPFEPRELVARIQSVLRRGSLPPRVEKKNYGKLAIDYKKRNVSFDGQAVDLTSMEFEILTVFTRHPGRVLNRDQILEELNGLDWEPFNRSIDVMISRLRQKLKDDPKHPELIKTVWGTGYMFIGEEE